MRRTGDILRAVAATMAVALLVGGLPAFLAASVGWPLPRQLPQLAQISDTLTGHLPLETTTVWKILALILWVAWLPLVVALVDEATATARGTLPRSLPGFSFAHALIAPLVGAIALAWPAGTTRQAAAATTSSSPELARPPAAAVQLEAPVPEPEATTATLEHTVKRRDTLWDLAERYLGDGYRATEIFNLNRGRPQPDGTALTDPSVIRPGWILAIPTPDPPTERGGSTTVTVERGDTLWSIAADELGDGHRFPELVDLNAGRPQPDGKSLTDPDVIEPGWQFQLSPAASAAPPASPAMPTSPAPAADPPPDVPQTTSPTSAERTISRESTTTAAAANGDASTTAGAPARDDTQAAQGRSADGGTTAPIGGALGVAGAMLATGLGALLALRRRRQLARRRPGTEPAPMPKSGAAVLYEVADVDVDYALGVDFALRQLGRSLGDRPSVPVPIVATLDGSNIDLLLDRSEPDPPDPWHEVAEGLIWRSRIEARTDEPDAGPAWLPAFVSIGALDAGGLLLNLEGVGAVAVTGDASATALARSIAVEMALTPLADVAAVHVVGDVIGDVTNLPRVRHHEDLTAALAAAEEDTAGISGALAGAGTPNAIELRCRARDEAWAPAIVVASATAAAPDVLALLLDRCHERAGVTAVLVGTCPLGALDVRVSATEVVIPALGLSCTPQQLEQETLDTIGEVLDLTDEACVEPDDDTPLTLFTPGEVGDNGAAAGSTPALYLHLLGPVRTDGAELSPQQLSLVAYLALHPGATADAVRDAIWGGKPPTRERFLNTMHELRRAVGPDVLPTSTDGRYRLRRVWCDLAEVERLVAEANPDHRAANLRSVLELAAGPPLTFESRHRRHFRWVDLGNHASRWERIVGDAAHDLAQLALDQGDVDLARWAAERGLLASPASQTLTCDLISAHLAAGDRNAAEHVVDEYGRVLEDMGYDEPPHEVQALLERRRAS
jgi:LysM repeat protein/DNA-binding SARP family transcriptional activator